MLHHGDCLDVMAAMEPESVDPLAELERWLHHKMNCASTEGFGVKDGIRLTVQKQCDCGLDAAMDKVRGLRDGAP